MLVAKLLAITARTMMTNITKIRAMPLRRLLQLNGRFRFGGFSLI